LWCLAMVARARGRPAAWLTSRGRVCAHPSPRRLRGKAKLSKTRCTQPAERSSVPTLTPLSRSTTARFFTHNLPRGRQRRIVEYAPSGATGCSQPCAIPPPHMSGDSCSGDSGRRPSMTSSLGSDSYEFGECLPATHVLHRCVRTSTEDIVKSRATSRADAAEQTHSFVANWQRRR
jgi:hypothetical protein